MIKADFTIVPGEQQKKETEECIRSLKQNQVLLQMMKIHNLSFSLIDRYPWKIHRWFESLQPCLNCKGIGFCGQKVRGYYENLEYDGMMQVVQTACVHQRKQLAEEAHMSRYLISDLPSNLHAVSFEKIRTEKEKREYLQVLTEAMEACESSKGLYLYGTMGSGKTYLAACASNYYARQGRKTAFIHYPSFCRRMAAEVQESEYKTEFDRACIADFLVIDDIGAESVTEWNRDQILLPLLSIRYEENLPTWFTSNEDMNSLAKHFRFSSRGKDEEIKADRIIERIEHLAKALEVTSQDRRKQL